MGGNFGPGPTVEDVAAHLFISVARLRQLQREDVLPRRNSGDWSLDGCRRRYIENLRAVKGNHLPKIARRLTGATDDGSNVVDLETERAKLAREQRVGHELKNAEARGELLPAPDVVEGWQAAIARARSLLLGIPPAAAEELMILASEGAAAVRERLADMIHAALSELANTEVEDVEDAA
jgi:phage terminase Nu1 subunit (DNA packaging protein)